MKPELDKCWVEVPPLVLEVVVLGRPNPVAVAPFDVGKPALVQAPEFHLAWPMWVRLKVSGFDSRDELSPVLTRHVSCRAPRLISQGLLKRIGSEHVSLRSMNSPLYH